MRLKAAARDTYSSPLSQQVAEEATLNAWLKNLQQQQHQPHQPLTSQQLQQQQNLQEEELGERLRVAIAITKTLSEVHEGVDKGEGGRYCGQFSLGNIFLDISDTCCVAALNIVDSDNNRISPPGEWTKEKDLKQLGCILSAVFVGENAGMGIRDRGEHKTEDDEPTKKRGKGQQTVENLPLYLTYIISSLIATRVDARGGAPEQYYESARQVLRDLQIAASKPEVYLKSNSWDDAKNNRLQIPPQSFYGRKSELSLVLHSLDTVLRFGQPVMVSVSGYAGTGKTTLLNQIKRPLEQRGGFMIRGKFDKVTPPNTVIFSALDSFFGKITSLDGALQAELKLRITESIGCGGGVLMSAIPNLRTLMEEEVKNAEEHTIEQATVSHQRWKYLIIKLINAISDKSRPLAFFMDDLHWCDEVTLDMIQAIVMDPDIRYCLFLGSYRINSQESGVTKTLDSIQSLGVRLVSLKVSCIEKEGVNCLISETLCIPPSLCQSLSTLVHSKTGGIILFSTNFLKSLHEEGMLRFNMSTRKWEYNINYIRQRKIPADVVKHLSERIKRLPNNAQSLLKIAACLGFKFDADLLQMAIRGKLGVDLLHESVESGFLQQEIPGGNKFVWAHDEIHLAAYELIPIKKRISSHLLIGSRIYLNTSSDELLYTVIFDIVNNMNIGLQLITSQDQRNEVAQLNLTAGRKAMASSSFDAAAEYFMVGIGLLADDCWECNYKPSMILHQAASEALFVAGDFELLKKVIDETVYHANCLDDKLQAYYCLVRFLHTSSNTQEAMEKTLSILSELGESLPEATPDLIYRRLESTKAILNNLTKQDILKGPRLSDKRILWTLRFMNLLSRYLFSTNPIKFPLLACRMIDISLEHGYCCDSVMGFAAFSLSQLNILQDIDEAYKWAKIALSISENFSAQALLLKLKCLFYTFTSVWKEPIQATCVALSKTHQDLLLVGDVELASVANFNYCRQSLFTGKELATVDKDCSSATVKMAELTHIQSYLSHSSHHLIIIKLSGNTATKNPFGALSGVLDEINNEDDLLRHVESTGKTGVVQAIRFNRLFLAYWFKRYEEAAEMANLYKTRTVMPLIDAYHAFYEGLTAFHFARHSSDDEQKWMEIGEKDLSPFRTWAAHSTWNWENKLLLLEAEMHFSKKEMEKAEEKYRAAIQSAQCHRFIHEEGLANELFSVFHNTNGNFDKAKIHISEARACYEKWGAFALIDLLDSS
ncbi:hypothetical protein ACHAXR_009167 [Thalassiosira sp. AJA248-18]